MTRIAPGVSVEVLDWGGRGAPLVFLAGLRNTAHVFDDFAPQFTDSFHVVGITRRGFGASSGSPPPRDLDTLVADITAVLDTLGVGSVILVGHSIAGEEMTRFAEIHGTRCDCAVSANHRCRHTRRQPFHLSAASGGGRPSHAHVSVGQALCLGA
jgi:pimeloyl-ACP methyl ester carboxylesterase